MEQYNDSAWLQWKKMIVTTVANIILVTIIALMWVLGPLALQTKYSTATHRTKCVHYYDKEWQLYKQHDDKEWQLYKQHDDTKT